MPSKQRPSRLRRNVTSRKLKPENRLFLYKLSIFIHITNGLGMPNEDRDRGGYLQHADLDRNSSRQLRVNRSASRNLMSSPSRKGGTIRDMQAAINDVSKKKLNNVQIDGIIASTASKVASYAIMTVMTQMILEATPAVPRVIDRPESPFARRVVGEAIVPIQAVTRGVSGRKQASDCREELQSQNRERDAEAEARWLAETKAAVQEAIARDEALVTAVHKRVASDLVGVTIEKCTGKAGALLVRQRIISKTFTTVMGISLSFAVDWHLKLFYTSAVRIQAITRGFMARRRVYHLIRYRAAVSIQCMVRRALASQTLVERLHYVAAFRIQGSWLRYLALQLVTRLRRKREEERLEALRLLRLASAIKIQHAGRGHIVRQRIRAFWHMIQSSCAVVIQCAARQYLARRTTETRRAWRAQEWVNLQEYAAVVIQAMARGVEGRRLVVIRRKVVAEQRRLAILQLQQEEFDRRVSLQQSFFRRLTTAAVVLQAAARGMIGRRRAAVANAERRRQRRIEEAARRKWLKACTYQSPYETLPKLVVLEPGGGGVVRVTSSLTFSRGGRGESGEGGDREVCSGSRGTNNSSGDDETKAGGLRRPNLARNRRTHKSARKHGVLELPRVVSSLPVREPHSWASPEEVYAMQPFGTHLDGDGKRFRTYHHHSKAGGEGRVRGGGGGRGGAVDQHEKRYDRGRGGGVNAPSPLLPNLSKSAHTGKKESVSTHTSSPSLLNVSEILASSLTVTIPSGDPASTTNLAGDGVSQSTGMRGPASDGVVPATADAVAEKRAEQSGYTVHYWGYNEYVRVMEQKGGRLHGYSKYLRGEDFMDEQLRSIVLTSTGGTVGTKKMKKNKPWW